MKFRDASEMYSKSMMCEHKIFGYYKWQHSQFEIIALLFYHKLGLLAMLYIIIAVLENKDFQYLICIHNLFKLIYYNKLMSRLI